MKKNEKRLEVFIYIACIVVAILFVFFGNRMNINEASLEEEPELYKAKVVSIEDVEIEDLSLGYEDSMEMKRVHFTARVTNGPYKDEMIQVIQDLDPLYVMQPKEIQNNNKIIVSPTAMDEFESDGQDWTFIEYDRTGTLILLTSAFLLSILLIGRAKGFTTILSMIFTVLAIFYVFIPSILNGRNIYLSTIVVTLFIIVISLTIINGPNKKTLCAILGNIGGVAVAGLIAIVINRTLNLTGFVDDDYVFLTYLEMGRPIDLVAIIWSGIVIGSLGAIMDVAMSISSSMNELSENMSEKTFAKLLKSGMNIGQDAIGTMTNTLVLAYVGSSLATVLLLIAYNKNLLYLFSLEMIAVEVLQAVVGSMGIVFAVPVTALFCAYIFTKEAKLE